VDGSGVVNWANNGGVAANALTGSGVTYGDISGNTIAAATSNNNNASINSATTNQVTTAAGAWTTHTLRIDTNQAGATGQSLVLNGALTLDATNVGAILFTGDKDFTISNGGSGSILSAIATNSNLYSIECTSSYWKCWIVNNSTCSATT
jgi:hypothetical protein